MPDPYETQKAEPPRPGPDAPTGPFVPGADAARLAVPARVDKYEVRAVLGAGTFGRVLLAFDPDTGRQVAIKQPFGEGLKAQYRNDFLKEARAAAAIDQHPNICPVYHVGTADGLPFIVMRFVAGGTLRNLLDRRPVPLPVPTALRLVRKVALGLAAAHAKGVIHRDLKPANVLCDLDNNEVLITDFGLARLGSGSRAGASLTGKEHGTPLYMPPEQWGTTAFGPITERADVYALGAMMYELLTGAPPFEGGQYELMTKHCTERPAPPSRLRADLDLRLDPICLKALAKGQADRYPSARAFADALGSYLRLSTADAEQFAPGALDDVAPKPPAAVPDAPRRAPPKPPPLPPPVPRAGATAQGRTGETVPERATVRCPKPACGARLEIVATRTKPVQCPMCDMVFAVAAGRQAELRALPEAEVLDDEPRGPRPRARALREPVREPGADDRAARAEWEPVASGLRLNAWGLVALLAAIVGTVGVAVAATGGPPRTGFAACALAGAGALWLIGLGRRGAARLPAGAGTARAGRTAALAAWLAAAALVVCAAAGLYAAGPAPVQFDFADKDETFQRTSSMIAPYALLAAALLALVSELALAGHLRRIGFALRRAFPRALVAVARWFVYVTFALAAISAAGAVVGVVLEPPAGDRPPVSVNSGYVAAGCLGVCAVGLGAVSLILNAITYFEAASAVRAYARCEEERD